MANPQNMIAGMKAAGAAGTSLAWMRNADGASASTLPQKATDTIDTSFLDMGNCDSKGADLKTQVSSQSIKSFGSLLPQLVLFTDYSATVDITFQETTPNVLEVFRSLPLGSIEASDDGEFSVGVGSPQDVRYELVVMAFSQKNEPMYWVFPNVANTNPGDYNLQMGQVLDRPVTFTVYPDDKGNLFYELYQKKTLSQVASSTSTPDTSATTTPATTTP